MRRPPHGGTSRPGPSAPGNGFGRTRRVRYRELQLSAARSWPDSRWWRRRWSDRSGNRTAGSVDSASR